MWGTAGQGDGEVRRREETRKKEVKPATTLFVVNFDVDRVRERDLERHFEPYGRLKRVQIKRNYGACSCLAAGSHTHHDSTQLCRAAQPLAASGSVKTPLHTAR